MIILTGTAALRHVLVACLQADDSIPEVQVTQGRVAEVGEGSDCDDDDDGSSEEYDEEEEEEDEEEDCALPLFSRSTFPSYISVLPTVTSPPRARR